MFRRYTRWHSRFDQPDPSDESYSLTNPQSLNRYSYINNDPLNFVDRTGLDPEDPPPTTHIDPVTGQPVEVPGINAGVVTVEAENTGLGLFGADTNQALAVIDRRNLNRGTPNPVVLNLVNTTFSNKDCQEFMSTILNIASTKKNPVLEGGDIQKIFADFLAQRKGGISRQRLTKYGSAAGRIGMNGKGSGTLYLPTYSDPTANQDWLDASGIVNELPHIAGSKGGWPTREEFDDYALAQAVHNSKYASSSSFKGQKNPFVAGVTDRYDLRWSSYFHDILRKYCVVPH